VGPALVGAAFISSSAVIIRLAGTAAGTAAFYRCALALPGLIVLALLEQRRHGRRALKDRARAAVAGGFLGVDLILWTHSIYDVGAGVATVLGNLQVVFVVFVAWAFFRERPRSQFLVALPVVMAGVVLVAGLTGKSGAGYHPVAGMLYGLSTSMAYAAFILVLRHSTKTSSHVAGPLADATAGAALAALVLGAALGQLSLTPPLSAFGWLLLAAFTNQTVGWLLITSSLPRLPAALSSLLLLFQPAVSLVLAAVVLSQRPTMVQLGGALLVCVGVLAAARSGGPGEAPGPADVLPGRTRSGHHRPARGGVVTGNGPELGA
jgi:drug/metabolite transporter (DMT)-like permease